MTKYTPEQRINAFWNKVNKDGSIPAHCPELGQCWEWAVKTKHTGYGQFWFNEQVQLAHRVSWIITNGEIPDDLCILHKCDNRKCVNPDHLFIGTNYDNAQDREVKGRGKQPKGEKHPQHKLTSEQVIGIYTEFKKGESTVFQLSNKYNISVWSVSGIVYGYTWKSITCKLAH